MTELKILNVFIPVQRSFESEGRHFVYGYATLWHQVDMHGTVLSKNVVEKSLPRLKKFPTLRYMHGKPIGKIIFNQEIEGLSTHIDQNGFHVLAQIFPIHTEEWETIKSGVFGFSYGLGFPKTEQREHNGQLYETFIDGVVYEISIVDSPSCLECNVNTIERYFISKQRNQKTSEQGFAGMLETIFPKQPPTNPIKRELSGEDRHFPQIFRAKLKLKAKGIILTYRDKPEYEQLTNREIQELLKKKKEGEK